MKWFWEYETRDGGFPAHKDNRVAAQFYYVAGPYLSSAATHEAADSKIGDVETAGPAGDQQAVVVAGAGAVVAVAVVLVARGRLGSGVGRQDAGGLGLSRARWL